MSVTSFIRMSLNRTNLQKDNNALYEVLSQTLDSIDALSDNSTTSSVVLPTGIIIPYGGTTAPSSWLICDGSAVGRIAYLALFNIIGTAYGVGDGTTTFNLPDFRQRFPLGKAASGTGSTLGGTGGGIDHTHTVPSLSVPALSIPAMGLSSQGVVSGLGLDASNNFIWKGADNIWRGVTSAGTPAPSIYADTTPTNTGTGVTGTGTSGTNNPPFQVVNYIIKT